MIAEALHRLRPGAEWVLRGDELEWLDSDQHQPSEKEIEAEVAYLKSDDHQEELRIDEVKRQRGEAYRKEADPLFFKFQRGETTEQEWLDKIAEIKDRFPKPE